MKKFLVLVALVFGFSFLSGSLTVEGKAKPVVEPAVVEFLDFEVSDLDGTGSMTFDLWAGQHIFAGTVTVTYVNGTLFITVDAVQDAFELHIGTYAALPTSRPAPGRMEFQVDGWEIGNELILIVHLAFDYGVEGSEVAGETAYAGVPANLKGAWFNYIAVKFVEVEVEIQGPGVLETETAYAFGEFSFIGEGLASRWGWYNVIEEGTYTFDIYAAAGQNDLTKGYYVGTVTVTYENGELSYEFNMFDGFEIVDYHIFAGNQLPSNVVANGQFEVADDLDGEIYLIIHLVVESELFEN